MIWAISLRPYRQTFNIQKPNMITTQQNTKFNTIKRLMSSKPFMKPNKTNNLMTKNMKSHTNQSNYPNKMTNILNKTLKMNKKKLLMIKMLLPCLMTPIMKLIMKMRKLFIITN